MTCASLVIIIVIGKKEVAHFLTELIGMHVFHFPRVQIGVSAIGVPHKVFVGQV